MTVIITSIVSGFIGFLINGILASGSRADTSTDVMYWKQLADSRAERIQALEARLEKYEKPKRDFNSECG